MAQTQKTRRRVRRYEQQFARRDSGSECLHALVFVLEFILDFAQYLVMNPAIFSVPPSNLSFFGGDPRILCETESRMPAISIRLTQDERKSIDAAISRSGLSQSDWARKSLLYIATNDIRIT